MEGIIKQKYESLTQRTRGASVFNGKNTLSVSQIRSLTIFQKIKRTEDFPLAKEQ